VGLLAGVFGDGIVRVLDIRSEWIGMNDATVNIQVSEAAWEYKFEQNTLATCVAWKSHTEIVVGCSNGSPSLIILISGFVAIFDLSDTTEDSTFPTII
jgi:hypothetical protein